MSDAATAQQEIERRIESILFQMRQDRLQNFNPRGVAWLALVPLWTEPLAKACRFPRGDLSLSHFVELAVGLDLCAQATSADPDGRETRQFWMPDAIRPGILETLRREQGAGFLLKEVATVGQSIQEAREGGAPVSPMVVRWAELAKQTGYGLGEANRWLIEKVRGLVKTNETGQALAWVRTGTALAQVLGGQLDDAVAQSKRRIELAYRQVQDEQHLKRFVERKEQIQAFESLLEGPDDLWALHYLGMGGVGKTMLMRHLGYYAPTAYSASVSRIDFDYLSPDYPVRRPGQLLLALGEELRLFFTTQSQDADFERFRDRLLELHELLSGTPSPDEPLSNLHLQEFDSVLDRFTELLKSLPKPVVLILDTCEELIKLQFGHGKLPHLAATFEILERVHERVPEVRVVYAGRRLLAQAGDGWMARLDRLPAAKAYLLEPKPYLRLHLIQGFNRHEAFRLLDRFPREEGSRAGLPPGGPAQEEEEKKKGLEEIQEAILEASLEHGTPAALYAGDGRPLDIPPSLYDRLRETLLDCGLFDDERGLVDLGDDERLAPWLREVSAVGSPADRVQSAIALLHDQRTQNGENVLVLLLNALGKRSGLDDGCQGDLDRLAANLQDHLARYSPFALRLYGGWFQQDRSLTAETIRSGGTDPYVEMRIVNRIGQDDVRVLLPAVALLRRFDATMLQPAFPGSSADFPEAFQALSDQEWMDYHRDPDSDAIWLEVDPNLHPRLRAYFEQAASLSLAEARDRLAPALAAQVRDTPLRQLRVEPINAALSLLPDGDAALLWSQVEGRIPQEADWSWALNVTRTVLGEEFGAAGGKDSLLRAVVYATYTAAHLQLSATYEAGPDWEVVEQILNELPPRDAGSALGRWLVHRARLGQIAATWAADRRPSDKQVTACWQFLAEWDDDPPQGLGPGHVVQLAGSLLAALEALLDWADHTYAPDLVRDPVLLRSWAEGRHDARLRAFAQALAGRAMALHQRWDKGAEELERAENLASSTEDDWRDPRPWADWHAPASLRDRVRLELLRLLPEGPSTERLQQWMDDAARPAGRVALIDSERLLSAVLQRLLDREPVSDEPLGRLRKMERYVLERLPVCAAHRETPPLFLTLARGWLARGDARQALDILETRLAEATQTAEDAPTVTAAARGLVEVARRMRLRDRARTLLAQQATQGWPDAESWALGALTGLIAPDEFPALDPDWPPERLHAWWHSQYNLTLERLDLPGMVAALAEVAATESVAEERLLEAIALNLDAWEGTLIARENPSSPALLPATSQLYSRFLERTHIQQRPAEAADSLRLLLRWIALEASPLNLPEAVLELKTHNLVDYGNSRREPVGPEKLLEGIRLGPVGKRRAAEIALEEGELLALRLPARAVLLLDQARRWFEQANDPVGATQAAILATLAAISAGDGQGARARLEETAAGYEQLLASGQVGDLPAWSRLIALRDAPTPQTLDMLDRPGWGGWLIRLFACLVWEADARGKPAGEATALFDQWSGGRLSPELRRIAAVELAYPKDEMPAGRDQGRRLGRSLLVTGTALLLGGGFLVGSYLGFKWLVDRISPVPLGNAVTLGLYGLAWLLTLLFPGRIRAVRDGIRSWLAARTEVELDIRPPAWEASEAAGSLLGEGTPVTFRLRQQPLALRLWPWPFLYRPEPTETEDSGRATVRQAYAQAAQEIPSQLASELAQLKERLGRRSLPVSLFVAQPLAAYPWEALLSLALPGMDKEEWREPFWFLRADRVEPPLAPPWDWDQVRVVAGETWAGLFEQAWRPLGAGVFVGQEIDWFEEAGPFKVLHLVGRPIQTRAGMRLQVRPGGYEVSDYATQSSLGREGTLISAADLPQARVGVVVIQGEPVEGLARRGSDREEAAFLRALAAETFAVGVPVVIALPTLPPDLAKQVLDRLSRGLRRRTPRGWQRWLHALHQVRQTIVLWSDRPESSLSESERAEALVELAMDVCLFGGQRRRGGEGIDE